MRSPSQRWRPSIEEWTPPRLVALTISEVDGLDGRGVRDVEGDQAAVAGVAHALHRRVGLEPPGELGRGLRMAPHPRLERRQAAQERARCVGRGGDAGVHAHLLQPLGVLAACDRRAEQGVVLAGQELRRRMEDDVGARVERLEVDRRRDGRVADDRGRGGPASDFPVRQGQRRVRRRLDPDDVGVGRRRRSGRTRRTRCRTPRASRRACSCRSTRRLRSRCACRRARR